MTEAAAVIDNRKIFAPPAAQTLKAGEFGMLTYFYQVPFGHKIDDLLKAEYWAHHSKRLKLHSLLHCVAVDGSFDVILRVSAGGEGWTKMRPLLKWEASSPDDLRDPTPAKARLKIDFAGGTWRVIHKDTAKIMGAGYKSRGEAEQAADELAKTLRSE
ncbi:MAG: hypothetical protein ACREJC_11120 [Tepidisphaeraceae bacterium]